MVLASKQQFFWKNLCDIFLREHAIIRMSFTDVLLFSASATSEYTEIHKLSQAQVITSLKNYLNPNIKKSIGPLLLSQPEM